MWIGRRYLFIIKIKAVRVDNYTNSASSCIFLYCVHINICKLCLTFLIPFNYSKRTTYTINLTHFPLIFLFIWRECAKYRKKGINQVKIFPGINKRNLRLRFAFREWNDITENFGEKNAKEKSIIFFPGARNAPSFNNIFI